MKINVSKCTSLAESWNGDKAVKAEETFFYRTYLGQDFADQDQWVAEQ
jgi:hypothetical protein